MKYRAEFKLNGESFCVEAESMGELEIKVFGRAYAPCRADVRFYQIKLT